MNKILSITVAAVVVVFGGECSATRLSPAARLLAHEPCPDSLASAHVSTSLKIAGELGIGGHEETGERTVTCRILNLLAEELDNPEDSEQDRYCVYAVAKSVLPHATNLFIPDKARTSRDLARYVRETKRSARSAAPADGEGKQVVGKKVELRDRIPEWICYTGKDPTRQKETFLRIVAIAPELVLFATDFWAVMDIFESLTETARQEVEQAVIAQAVMACLNPTVLAGAVRASLLGSALHSPFLQLAGGPLGTLRVSLFDH